MKTTCLALALACLLAAPAFPGAQRSAWESDDVPRVVILGDVHASYDKMVTLLRGTKMVDERLNWIGGDLTDRGTNDRGVLDLARRLQGEAAAAGGRVHVVLGNHDVMNLARDRRYWSADLLDEFADDETEEERKAALREFRTVQQTQGAGEAFGEKFPPGYFARARAFEPDGEYGSWLLQQPTVIKVNGVLFVHGGLTRRVAKLGLDEINRRVTDGIREFIEAADALGNAVPFPADLREIVLSARELKNRSARAVLEAHDGLAFDSAGPLWYRGTSVENERLERTRVADDSVPSDYPVHPLTPSSSMSSQFEQHVQPHEGLKHRSAPIGNPDS